MAQSRPSRSRRASSDPARRVALDVLRAVSERDAYANLLLPSLLSERGIVGRDAAFATELTYGTLRGRGTYDAILAVCSDRDKLDPAVRDVLRLGAHQLLATRTGNHAAVSTSVDLVKEVCGPRPSGFVNAVLRRVASRDLESWLAIIAPDRSADEIGHLAIRYSYPRWIVESFRDALTAPETSPGTEETLPAETEQALAAGNARPEVTLAILPPSTPGLDAPAPGLDAPAPELDAPAPGLDARAPGLDAPAPDGPAPGGSPLVGPDLDVPDLGGLDLVGLDLGGMERTRWSPFGLRLAGGGDPTPLIGTGRAAAQDEASQLVAIALAGAPLNLSPDGLWLDLCAGPGGKARLLHHLAAERGARLVAGEVRPRRAAQVRDALSRAVGGTAGVVVADGRRIPWGHGTFDRVLADVPCSGLGSLRRRPEARWRKNPSDIPELAALQRQLLTSAIESVRPGGVVAYVTCSPHVAETQDVVTSVVSARTDVVILDAPAILAEAALSGAIRAGIPDLPTPRDKRFAQFWPHRHGTDAIFIALLRRE